MPRRKRAREWRSMAIGSTPPTHTNFARTSVQFGWKRGEYEPFCKKPFNKLQRCYKLQEEPYLVLIHPNGDVLYTGAVEDVRECFRWQCCFHPDSRLGMDTKKAEGTVDYWCWMMDRGNTALVVP